MQIPNSVAEKEEEQKGTQQRKKKRRGKKKKMKKKKKKKSKHTIDTCDTEWSFFTLIISFYEIITNTSCE